MALTTLKPRLASAAPRLGYLQGDTKAQDKHRNSMAPWRAWYHTARWQKLRQRILIRDCYTCQRTGRVLGEKHPHPDSPVVDHIKPHRGDAALFWDEANLQVISKAEHDGRKQAEERAHP